MSLRSSAKVSPHVGVAIVLAVSVAFIVNMMPDTADSEDSELSHSVQPQQLSNASTNHSGISNPNGTTADNTKETIPAKSNEATGNQQTEVTKATQQNDPFLNWPVSPTAVIKLHEVLNHGLDCADGLRVLKPTSDKSAAFFRYFQDDTTPAAALAPHKTKLARQEDGEGLLASSAVNPPVSTVYHWFCGWRRGQYGDEGVSPLTKLDRRAPNHVEHSCLEGAFRKLDWESKHRTTPKKPAPAHPQGKANRWQQSLNSSSCLWIPSHSWRPRAQLEAVTNDTAKLQKIYEEWWRQPSLAAGNPYYATALQQLLRQMHKIRKEPQEGACP
ncbi:uncharacterized protein LOC144159891 [Haemaphysalis longicornis]